MTELKYFKEDYEVETYSIIKEVCKDHKEHYDFIEYEEVVIYQLYRDFSNELGAGWLSPTTRRIGNFIAWCYESPLQRVIRRLND